MKAYALFKHDGRVTPSSFDLVECNDDVEARSFAFRLLEDQPEYEAVEVWDGDHKVFRVERPANA
jgi:hypothetical protein